MTIITQVAQAMQRILIVAAEKLGQETKFIRRQRALSGGTFVQTLVLAFQAKPAATYSDLSAMAASLGVEVSPQGIAERFTPAATNFVERVLGHAVEQVVASQPTAIPILQRFTGVYLQDSSVVSLPAELADVWPGVGGSQGATAALKLQVCLNFSTGQLQGPLLQSGRTQDQTSPFQAATLPPGALRLADLGFFNLGRLAQDNDRGTYWCTWLKHGTAVYDLDGQRIDLLAWLKAQSDACLDRAILVGARERLACRLIAIRVPQEVAEQRRRRLREYARKKQVPLSEERLALAAWSLIIVNLPETLASPQEILALLGVRWQIELLFKLWKHYGKIDEWRSHNPWRILCELYAKLIGLVMFHWIALTSVWQCPDRSLFKAVQIVQQYALAIAIALADLAELTRVLTRLQQCLIATCHMNKRKAYLNTYQILLGFA